ncbi:MAG: hypothetical protein KME42_28255 [Tildeniella nuda ZEHNDER 1965/U140]|jgi:hypothetical protein|nr:hypothetical protein [Tildeniella nuda ZEHNDER 1965/U140]
MDKFCLLMLGTWTLTGVILAAHLWRDVYAPKRILAKAFPLHLPDQALEEGEIDGSPDALSENYWQTIVDRATEPKRESPIAPASDEEKQWMEAGYHCCLMDLETGENRSTIKELISEAIALKAGKQTREEAIAQASEGFAAWLEERGQKLGAHALTNAARVWRDENLAGERS